MARYDHLPIWKDAVTLATVLEETVRRFPRYHKYALGADLRRQAYAVCRAVVVANGERGERAPALERLVMASVLEAPRVARAQLPRTLAALRRARRPYALVREEGYLKGGLRRRTLQACWWPAVLKETGRSPRTPQQGVFA